MIKYHTWDQAYLNLARGAVSFCFFLVICIISKVACSLQNDTIKFLYEICLLKIQALYVSCVLIYSLLPFHRAP